MNIRPTVRPLPWFSVSGDVDGALLAQALRTEFLPKIARRLPGHHLVGFRHDAIPEFVRNNKKRYPCFLRTDISKFYPSIRHREMIVGVQLAYRDLLGLDYVTREFKRQYVGAIHEWCRSLPLPEGIPLGSPLSALLAPLMLVPLWLEMKRRFRVPFLVYMDDLLVLCEDEDQAARIYAFVADRLYSDYGLTLNHGKTSSGRFSRQSVSFCGWRFAGGYAGISQEKVEAFKARISEAARQTAKTDLRAFIKRINRKMDGFGHYYKYGEVGGRFRELDTFVRGEIRKWLAAAGHRGYTVKQLDALGLRSLAAIHAGVKRKAAPPRRKTPVPVPPSRCRRPEYPATDAAVQSRIAEALEKIQAQMSQIVSMGRKQIRLMEELMNLA